MSSVLLVDDEAWIRAFLGHSLTRLGLSVVYQSSGKFVSQLVRSGDISLVVLDILMAGQDGFETLTQLRSDFPEVPVIAISSNSDYLEFAQTLGAAAIVQKPVYVPRFEALVSELLNLPAPQAE